MTELDAYLQFRKEIDTMFYPKFARLNDVLTRKDEHGNVIAMLIVENKSYIDCLWIDEKYREKGIGTALVVEYVLNHKMPNTLHILNNNNVAYRFWNNIFNLYAIEANPYDTLYGINGFKEKRCDD